MADSVEFSAFTKRELGRLAKTFTLMGDEAVERSRKIAYEISDLSLQKIKQAAYKRTISAGAVRRVVDGAVLSKTSKTGRITIGYANQRFSGGANTGLLYGPLEFGTKRSDLKQFPTYSGRFGAGSRGWFIYPTLREFQPQLTLMYIKAMNEAVKEWSN
jgi:hypothetical protein